MVPRPHVPYLVGAKVYLRPLEESDAAECWAWLNDPEVRRTLAAWNAYVRRTSPELAGLEVP